MSMSEMRGRSRRGRGIPEGWRTRMFHAAISMVAFGAMLSAVTGCSGGSIDLISLNYRSIDPPAPRVLHFPMDRAVWWTDESGQLWVALERVAPSILGKKFQLVIRLSIRLEKLPAGKARNYAIRRNELRGVARLGPTENRFMSTNGIAAIYHESENRLRGTFRIEVGRFVSELLTGWSSPSRYLMMGSFEAVRDERRGKPIAEETEQAGFEREDVVPHATSQPMSTSR